MVFRSSAATWMFGSVSSVTSAVFRATCVTLPMRPSAFTTGSLTRMPEVRPAAIPICWSNSLGGRLMIAVAT